MGQPRQVRLSVFHRRMAGGRVRGEFVPGEPCLFAIDPDSYEFGIWYEIPTKADPPLTRVFKSANQGRTTGPMFITFRARQARIANSGRP
jgi:hypothetical protein